VGPVGLVAFAAVLASMLGVALGARRRARPDSDERLLASALAASMLSLMFVGFTVASFTWNQVSLLASCLLGLAAGLHRLTREAQTVRRLDGHQNRTAADSCVNLSVGGAGIRESSFAPLAAARSTAAAAAKK
jgi:O-antigen ligase